MNLTETTMLLALVSQIMPAQKIDEMTPDAWTLVLDDVSFEDAKAAVITCAKRLPFVAPAEIIAEVRRMRRDRLDGCDVAVPDADPDDPAAYLAAVKAGRMRIADGLKPRPVAALLGQAARQLPSPPRR